MSQTKLLDLLNEFSKKNLNQGGERLIYWKVQNIDKEDTNK